MAKVQVISINFGTREATFQNNGKKRVELEDGMVAVNMDLITADGAKYDAVGVFDESSSGEHWDTFVFFNSGFYDMKELIAEYGFKSEAIFPYKYKYRVPLNCCDHHVGDDGWSG